ncbi:MAG: hypothetical protein M3Q88_03120 [Pseudomonadota bacterium]|nr:hypothetical protein [Pseudomonadota bacterium]
MASRPLPPGTPPGQPGEVPPLPDEPLRPPQPHPVLADAALVDTVPV